MFSDSLTEKYFQSGLRKTLLKIHRTCLFTNLKVNPQIVSWSNRQKSTKDFLNPFMTSHLLGVIIKINIMKHRSNKLTANLMPSRYIEDARLKIAQLS